MNKEVSLAILYVSINATIDTMLKFDTNADMNVNIDAQCERTFRLTGRARLIRSHSSARFCFELSGNSN